jgi:hypothetical protein
MRSTGPALVSNPPVNHPIVEGECSFRSSACICSSCVHGPALYFVTVQNPDIARSFVATLPASPPDFTLLNRLSSAPGLLGRVLSSLNPHTDYLVGTSDTPVDVSSDYMNHIYNFQELQSWALVEQEGSAYLSLLTPVPASPARSALLATRRMADVVPVYVLYIYYKVRVPYLLRTAITDRMPRRHLWGIQLLRRAS